MATSLGRVYLNGCNYELAYDLLSQSTTNNQSSVRLYGILHVTNNYISWSSGSASVHTSGLQAIGTYYSKGDHTVITRDFTFDHDANGNFSSYIGASLSTTFVSGDTGGTLTLPKIDRYPQIINGMNFTDEQNPTLTFSNQGLYPVRVKLEAGGDTQLIIRDISQTATSYTFELTETERNTLRALCPNSNTLEITEAVCAMSGNTELSSSWKKYTMTIVNGNPTFTNFEYEDTNPTTVALTGSTTNNVININGYSNIKATISTTNKAVGIKSATMSKYRFSIGDSSTDIAYSSSASVNGTINNATNGTYNVYAIDSRNNSTLVTKLATREITYQNVYINKQNCSLVRDDNQVGENAILTLSGTFWNDNFGSVSNSLTVSYRLKKTSSSTWITGTTTITPTTSENNFTFTGLIASDNNDTTWDLDASYNVEVTISDALSSASVELILNSSTPTLSLDEEGVGVLCAYDRNLGGSLQVKGKIIDGGKLLWTNPSPSSTFNAQTITLSSDDYDILEIFYLSSYSSNYCISQRFLKGCNTMILSGSVIQSPYVQRRYMDRIDDTHYKIQNTEGAYAGDNNNLVPTYVIGYKTNLFS